MSGQNPVLLITGASSGSGWSTDALVLLAIAVVGVPLSVLVFDAALAHATKNGTLSQY